MQERPFADTGVISLDPLITYTKRHVPTPIGLAGRCPELFTGRPSLHLIGVCWALYPGDIAEIASEIRRMASVLPNALFVFLATSDHDLYRLSAAGIPCLLANTAIFTDEKIFRPMPPFEEPGFAYDAIYNARFEPYKRHELARLIQNLALVYDSRFDGSESPFANEVRAMFPKAHYINHDLGGGAYVSLDKSMVTRELNRSRCGLCLSEVEGYMRAAMEYLLCGLPIVTTESIGGRDRYFQHPFVIKTSADPQSVRDAVAEMVGRKLNKHAIRDHVGRIVDFERRNFLAATNTIVRDVFGTTSFFSTVRPFIETYPFCDPDAQWSRIRLEPLADALGVTLAPLADTKLEQQ